MNQIVAAKKLSNTVNDLVKNVFGDVADHYKGSLDKDLRLKVASLLIADVLNDRIHGCYDSLVLEVYDDASAHVDHMTNDLNKSVNKDKAVETTQIKIE